MRIVYFSSAIVPSRAANSIQVMKMCHAFAKNGHEVFLFVPKNYKNMEEINYCYDYYGVESIFKIVRLPRPKTRGSNLIYLIMGLINIILLKPDLVYGRYLPGCVFSCIIGVPTIFESHSIINDSKRKILFNIMIKKKHFKHLVVLSNYLKNYFINNYEILSNLITVAYNGSDEKNISSKQLSKYSSKISGDLSKFQVGYIGHLYPGKGMEVISELAKRCLWANFHIVGGTEEDIIKWKELLSGYSNIFFYGYVNPHEVSYYCRLFDILLLPPQKKVKVYGGGSFNQINSPPIKLFEFMESGKAIISSNFLNEVLIHKENALLCDPQKPHEWEEALTLLKNEISLRKKLEKNAREDFLKKYTWVARANKVLSRNNI